MQLKEICDYIHNYFEYEYFEGEFAITDGSIDLSKVRIQNNQYYMIEGSVFNDGIHKHVSTDLNDETFRGTIITMRVPKDVLDVLQEATEWQNSNKTVLQNPLNSESFGGYSYQKASSGQGNAASSNPTWQSSFANELNRWRKI